MADREYTKEDMFRFALFYYANWDSDKKISDLLDYFISLKNSGDASVAVNKPDVNGSLLEHKELIIQVEKYTCDLLGISLSEIHSPRKYGDIPTARQISAFVCHSLGYPDAFISKVLGRDRVSVLQQTRKCEVYCGYEGKYRAIVNSVLRKFGLDELNS